MNETGSESNDSLAWLSMFHLTTPAARIEYPLPSGQTIVDDHDSGLAARIEMREGVNWKTFSGTGDELQEGDVKQRAAKGACFVVLRYQDTVNSEGNVATSMLRSVEEYSGHVLTRQQELAVRVEPPRHLTGTFILSPHSVYK
jgi:hypothetical protein